MDGQIKSKTLYVGGLSAVVTSQTLHNAFIPFGPINDISLPKPELPSNKDPHRGFGYIEFEHGEDAREALDNMDQSEIAGRVIRVNVAKERKAEGEGLGSKTAIWEQEGYLTHAHDAGDEPVDEPEGDAMDVLAQRDVAGPQMA